MGAKDVRVRQDLAVGTVPFKDATTAVFSVDPYEVVKVVVTTTPDSSNLSLWQFLWSMNVDVDNIQYEWPGVAPQFGGSLLDPLLVFNIAIMDHVSYEQSNDLLNIRIHAFAVVNYDLSPHTFYFYYKGYTNVTNSPAGTS